MIPAEVVATDHKLEGVAEKSQEALARLRWHWTLDETNPDRVSFREYARAVGRAYFAVARMANGYAAHVGSDQHVLITSLTDQIALAGVGETKRKAAQLIAEAGGTNVANVLSHRRREVLDLVDTATEAAERRGTSVDDELERAAAVRRKAADGERNRAEQAKARRDARYIEIEGHVAAVMRRMKQVLTLARTVELGEEHIELVTDSIAAMRALLGLIDMQLTGTVDVDWDAELAKLGGAK